MASEAIKPRYTPRRGRPNASQAAAIDETILATGRDMFLRDGYAAISMEAIALGAGVSKGTLYGRYPDKESLFREIVVRRLEAWDEFARYPALPTDTAPDKVLYEFGVTFLECLRMPEIAAFDRLVTAEARRFPELARAFHERGNERAMQWLSEMLDGSATSSSGPTFNGRFVAEAFMASLLGWHSQEALRQWSEPRCPAKFVHHLVSIFVRGTAAW